jgi:predicted O-linked N-acetylglucosamine transferase (SPINDLY family)
VNEEKIIIKSLQQRYDVLNFYNEIDIALDPFPYSGCVTSFEASWMGCPILTKKGKTFLSRTGESINLNIGLKDFIANSDEDYIKKAIYYSNNYNVLKKIKEKLAMHCRNSNIFNTKMFAEDFYKMLLDISKNYYLN